mmetsp:Transcript_9917/g.15016  ORF Transcript_9917/g.15016 Transcript_9917/m.15016 type:complete len:109 (+) Transcript_9917:425-751(+)
MRSEIQNKLLAAFSRTRKKHKMSKVYKGQIHSSLNKKVTTQVINDLPESRRRRSDISKMPHLKGNSFRFAHGAEIKYRDQVNMKILDRLNLNNIGKKEEPEPIDPNAY